MSSRSGGLMELVSRGKKDVFFTSNPSVSFFHSVYKGFAPFTKEIYTIKPRNVPEWGHSVDFDIDHRGDIAKNFFIRLKLPTWLPTSAVEANQKGIVTDYDGITYGYVNNVGFLAIRKIQYFTDNVLLHETYGEYLDWRLRSSYEFGTTYLFSKEIGSYSESALSIARSSTPSELRVPIPLLGWQHIQDPGLPLAAMRDTRLRIRVHLRKLEELVVASDRRLRPAPWNGMPLKIQSVKGGSYDTSQVTLPYSSLRAIDISLESTRLYVPQDVVTFLKAGALQLPFLHTQFESHTIPDNVLTAANNGAVNFPIQVEFEGPVDRLLMAIRSEASTLAGDLTNLSSPVIPNADPVLFQRGDPFIRTIRLNIANIDRIKQWNPAFFRETTSYWKNRRMPLDLVNPRLPAEIYTISFGGFDYGVPAGTTSFSRAILPTLWLSLNATPYDRRNTSRKAFALIYAESWNILELKGGRCALLFDES